MRLVFLLEEASAREMLKGLLPRVLPQLSKPGNFVQYIAFEGKYDLDKQLERKLRGWRSPDTLFVVLRDQDSADCRMLKNSLVAKCRSAGRPDVVVRIACRELESWYLGDLVAVEEALGISNLVRYGNRSKYRNPDDVRQPSVELQKITRHSYSKVAGSRSIGPRLSVERSRSHSFRVFVDGVRRAVEQRQATLTTTENTNA